MLVQLAKSIAILVLLIVVSGCALMASGCQGPDGHYTDSSDQSGHRRFEFIRPIMGMAVRIVLYSPDEQTANTVAQVAFERLRTLDQTLSDWKSDSELTQLNGRAGDGPVVASQDLFHAIQMSIHYADRTGGAFDPTVGPIVHLWRRARERQTLPDVDALVAALDLVGWQHVRLDETAQTIELTRPGMQLDLGGIGKGLAGDAAATLLNERGIHSFLIDLGGDLILGAPPPGERGWSVRIDPSGETIPLAHVAVATSGDSHQFVEIDGQRFSHIVNPRTGLGLTHRLQVTVISPTGTAADALASAVSVLGREQGSALLESDASDAGVIAGPNDEGDMIITRTSRWMRMINPRPPISVGQ